MILRLAAEVEKLALAIDRASDLATMGLLLLTCWFAMRALHLVWPTLRWATRSCFRYFKKATPMR